MVEKGLEMIDKVLNYYISLIELMELLLVEV